MLCAVVGWMATAPARAQAWDATADFSLAGNPNGAWTYGWTPSIGGPFTPMDGICSNVWCTSTSNTTWPYIGSVPDPGSTAPAALLIHPKFNGIIGVHWYSVVRWTAPVARTVELTGIWTHASTAPWVSTDVRVHHNGVAVPGTSSYITFGITSPFNATLVVAPGDHVDFIVGTGGSDDSQDGCRLAATIATRCGLAITAPNGPGSISVANSGCTPLGFYLIAATAVQGAFPDGWFYGVDIPFFELLQLLLAGPPFYGTFDAAGASSFTVPGGLPSGYTLYAATVDVNLATGLALQSSPPVMFTIP